MADGIFSAWRGVFTSPDGTVTTSPDKTTQSAARNWCTDKCNAGNGGSWSVESKLHLGGVSWVQEESGVCEMIE